MRLTDRVALVTGAGGGIGGAVARVFADNGATVVAADLKGAAETIDVTDRAAVDALVTDIVGRHGRIDIVANVAGIGSSGPFTEVTPEEFERVMRINVTGTFHCAQAAAREMLKRGYGRIINIASISGGRAGQFRTAYGTSKAAVIGLTRQMAKDLGADGITANAIGPGPVDTPLTQEHHTEITRKNYNSMIPAGRYGTVDEIADAALFLAGEAAGYVNGQILYVDGGYMASGVNEVSGD